VLDSLPDSIIIANTKQISYLNQEAWKMLNCQSQKDELVDMDTVFCLD
jgi:sensor histidine kinase regulating citrate/malate metabolism